VSFSCEWPRIDNQKNRHVVDKGAAEAQKQSHEASSARNETRGIGPYPWFSITLILYHTRVCYSEWCGEYAGQLDPRSSVCSFCSYSLSGFSGIIGPMNEVNNMN
jgi:hypothetical protein